MSTDINQNRDEIETCTQYKYIVLICMVILISFGIKIQSWTQQHDIYHDVFIDCLSSVGIGWLCILLVDLNLTKRRLKHALDNPSDVTHKDWTHYTYLKAPHSYCFYLKVGLTIFCCVHLILTATLLNQDIFYWTNGSKCFDGLRLYSSILDLSTSLLQLYFIRNHSNLVINRKTRVSLVGCMILIAVALLKWFSTIASEADFLSPESQEALKKRHNPNWSKLVYARDRSYQGCPSGTLYNIDIANFLYYIDPFTIEFNFLLAVQWFIVWQHIGQYNENEPSKYWTILESHEPNNGIDELKESISFHKSRRGIFAGLFCLFGSVVSLIYYFGAVGEPSLFETAIKFTHWEDLIYLTAALLAMSIVSLQFTRLGNLTESCIGKTDLLLLFLPLLAFAIRGYILYIDSFEVGLIDRRVELLGVAQPVAQALFIYYAKSKTCDTIYLSQHKPGRQIVTLLIFINLALWISGAFRAKAKSPNHNLNHISHVILLDICQPFILFYRYHASVCLANIWKIVYSD